MEKPMTMQCNMDEIEICLTLLCLIDEKSIDYLWYICKKKLLYFGRGAYPRLVYFFSSKWFKKIEFQLAGYAPSPERHNVVVRAPQRQDAGVPWRRRDGGFCPIDGKQAVCRSMSLGSTLDKYQFSLY